MMEYHGANSSTYSAWRDATLDTISFWQPFIFMDRDDVLRPET